MNTLPVASSTELKHLELIIDRIGLANTLAALATVCYAKADHIRENWQDNMTAKVWQREAYRLDAESARTIREGI